MKISGVMAVAAEKLASAKFDFDVTERLVDKYKSKLRDAESNLALASEAYTKAHAELLRILKEES